MKTILIDLTIITGLIVVNVLIRLLTQGTLLHKVLMTLLDAGGVAICVVDMVKKGK